MKNHSHPSIGFLRRGLGVLALATTLVRPHTSARAESFSLDWFTLDGGGGGSRGGEFFLEGTVGQPDVAECAGGVYSLTGGFWTGVHPGPRPRLTVQRAGPQLVLRWPAWGASWVPLGKESLGPSSGWQSIPSQPVLDHGEWTVTLRAGTSMGFFVLWLP